MCTYPPKAQAKNIVAVSISKAIPQSKPFSQQLIIKTFPLFD